MRVFHISGNKWLKKSASEADICLIKSELIINKSFTASVSSALCVVQDDGMDFDVFAFLKVGHGYSAASMFLCCRPGLLSVGLPSTLVRALLCLLSCCYLLFPGHLKAHLSR